MNRSSGLSDKLTILPLTPLWNAKLVQWYHHVFATAPLPYGQQVSPHYFTHRLFGSRLLASDCSFIAVDASEEVVGMVMANRYANPQRVEADRLWLQLMGVAPTWQRQGVGGQLLATLLQLAAQEGKLGVATALQWAGIWPGIPCELAAMLAFCHHSHAILRPGEVYLEQNLDHHVKACNRQSSTTHKIIPYDPIYKASLYPLIEQNFSIGWQHEILSRIDANYEPFNGYGLANLRSKCLGDGLWIMVHQEKTVGFFVVQADEQNNQKGYFGPIGLDPVWRGQGWGRKLFLFAANHLRELDFSTMGLWTSDHLADHFYRSFNLRQVTNTKHAQWNIL